MIKKIIIPQENEKDLAEISSKIKKDLTIMPVRTVDEVLRHALTKRLSPIEWPQKNVSEKRDQESKVTAHWANLQKFFSLSLFFHLAGAPFRII